MSSNLASLEQSNDFRRLILKWLKKDPARTKAEAARRAGMTSTRIQGFLQEDDRSRMNRKFIESFCKNTGTSPSRILGEDPADVNKSLRGLQSVTELFARAKSATTRRRQAQEIAARLVELTLRETKRDLSAGVIFNSAGVPTHINLQIQPKINLGSTFWPTFRIDLQDSSILPGNKVMFSFYVSPNTPKYAGVLSHANLLKLIRKYYQSDFKRGGKQ